jgi:sugar/nucleoside kinase (ribokinase family)
MSIVVVGTVAFDKIETPFDKTDKILGGAATYISLAASQLGGEVNLVSVVGGDFPQKYFNLFEDYNINTEGLQVKPEGKSFFWSGKYHSDMNSRDTLVTDLNVLADFDPVLPESYTTPEFLVLGNLTPSVQMRVLDQLKKRPRLIVMDTMNFWMDTAWDDLLKVIARVDVLTVNDGEARQLTGEYSLVKAAQKILTMGPKFLVIKKGEHGALLFNKENVFFAPALPLEEVFDPTGAGDTFAGGFIGHLARTKDISFHNLKNAIIYGSAMASFTVEKFGTEGLQGLSHETIEDRVKLFIDLVQFDISLVNK